MDKIQEYTKTKPQLTRAVVGFCIKDGTVLLGVRKKTSLGLGLNLIAGIGGKVGDMVEFQDETEDEALIREMREEVGITITSFHSVGRVNFYFPNKPKWNQTVAIYVIDSWESAPLETDVTLPQWFEISSPPYQQMWDDAQYWLPIVLEGRRINASFLYGADNTTVIDKQIEVIEENQEC